MILNNEPDFETEDEAIIDADAPPDEMSNDPLSGEKYRTESAIDRKGDPRFGTPLAQSLNDDVPIDVARMTRTDVKLVDEESDEGCDDIPDE